jgi:hypothetical protein
MTDTKINLIRIVSIGPAIDLTKAHWARENELRPSFWHPPIRRIQLMADATDSSRATTANSLCQRSNSS